MVRDTLTQPFMVSRAGIASALGLLVVSAAVFAGWPDLDLRSAALFYEGQGRFIGATAGGETLRRLLSAVPFVAGGVLCGLYGLRRSGHSIAWAPSGRGVVMLIVSLLLGPGLLVNVALKDHWHRPRPVQVTAFGGPDPFRPFDRRDGLCDRNCSFVSGEGATAVWALAPALLVPPPWRTTAVVAAVGLATTTSLLRMAFGGHFLSDTVFAALLTWLVIALCWHATLRALPSPDRTSTNN